LLSLAVVLAFVTSVGWSQWFVARRVRRRLKEKKQPAANHFAAAQPTDRLQPASRPLTRALLCTASIHSQRCPAARHSTAISTAPASPARRDQRTLRGARPRPGARRSTRRDSHAAGFAAADSRTAICAAAEHHVCRCSFRRLDHGRSIRRCARTSSRRFPFGLRGCVPAHSPAATLSRHANVFADDAGTSCGDDRGASGTASRESDE